MLQNHTREQEQRLRQERAAHVSEVANLRAHVSQLQVQSNVKDAELLSVHHQNERLETDKTSLEKEIDDAKEENASLLAEVEALNKVIVKNAKDAEEERNKLEAASLEARTLKENMKDARRLMKKATFLLKGVCVPDADAKFVVVHPTAADTTPLRRWETQDGAYEVT
ncbi:hypothetical protein VNI00_005176 [Paramarasmius palmivorus]|uniref:Uncharacterized protein n=1 Tax=Paramarasmius palmivorus TaxID=297713 RepID=A0AAW0DJW4_9AGAR